MTTILSNFVTRKLCENKGCMEFKLLDQIIEKTFTVDRGILHDVLCNDGKFAIKEGNKKASGLVMSPDSVIVAKTTLRVCRSLPGECLQCDELHLCRYFVCGKCKFGDKCKNGHTVNVPHNMTQLNGVGLQELKEEELFQLLLQNDPHLLPEVCSHYNKGAGEHGLCKFNTTCTNLHLCLHFLQGDCKFGSACKRDHTLNGQADKILTGRGFDLENIQNLLTIYRNKFIILGHVPTAIAAPASAALPVVRERTAIASSGSSISEAERNEICLYFLRKHCSFKENCVRVHHHLPYRWQVRDIDGVTWKDLPEMEVIEKAFCDPANATSPSATRGDDFLSWLTLKLSAPGGGGPPVHFQTMSCAGSDVRRLSTASSVSKPPHFDFTTQWLWYWQDRDQRWYEYGKAVGPASLRPAVCSVTSKTLENIYLADAEAEIPFTAEKHNYTLSFKAMRQQNTKYQTMRDVRRRPVFVSALDIEAKLKSVLSEASGSSSSSSSSVVDVPSHWDRSPGSLPDFSYKLVPLSSSMKEYQMVEKLFMRTMSSSTIHSIHRNQNTSLWRVFHWQKEQMQARNGGKAVDERYLFHGTDESVVKAICEQNLDWRDSGVNGTRYGIGSYFARDAKYSNAFAKSRTSRKKMFAALVLVGEFVKGAGSDRKPPSKSAGSGSSSSRYDSCVDNVANPSIFVVFEKQQIYPEYVIDYS